ncbi:DUF402 domain-containing protein [Halorubellus sp. PRR65]|uniref:DUF402 domain-containing protein n=1 Tax=Halorubellus sp. PRR65 TaxID=3098148 RepID=UPI002B25AFB7|nr:DUF402 domain-containing protein [Halorubellus sp. PRR65]
MRARVRGIYTTAVTQRLLDADHDVVQASPPIRERFDREFGFAPADVAASTTADRQGVALSGDPDAVEALRENLSAVGVDALSWDDPAPEGAVFLAPVTDALGSGAVVDLGDREAFLPFDDADGYVEAGDLRRVQVVDPAPPWGDDRPEVAEPLSVRGGLVALDRARSGVSANVRGERATELVRTTELLQPDPPDGWGVRWQRAAADADMSALGDALDAASDRARALDALPDGDPDDAPVRLDTDLDDAPPAATAWVWFGRDSRFALDDDRRAVATTMPGHHRVKAGSASASDAVDFAEGVLAHAGDGAWANADDGDDLPFDAVVDAFGPRDGGTLTIEHGKPEGRRITLGRGRITNLDADAKKLTVERDMAGGGTYDALGIPREEGDVAVTKLTEGKWWYPTVYRSEDGEKKGTYVNVCTPVELFPDGARYVDLHVDVVKHADGTVERVDDDELDAAVDAGHVSPALADRARTVAQSVTRALR